MKSKRLNAVRAAATFTALLAATPVLAHHFPGVFDRSREIVLDGVVTEFRWGTPHSWMRLDIADADGNVESWSVEMDPASHLLPRGWNAKTVQPGDRVAVTVHPLRNDEKGGQYVRVELPDGTLMN